MGIADTATKVLTAGNAPAFPMFVPLPASLVVRAFQQFPQFY